MRPQLSNLSWNSDLSPNIWLLALFPKELNLASHFRFPCSVLLGLCPSPSANPRPYHDSATHSPTCWTRNSGGVAWHPPFNKPSGDSQGLRAGNPCIQHILPAASRVFFLKPRPRPLIFSTSV